MLRNGGAVSHHHGVGKRKKQIFYKAYPRFMLDSMVHLKRYFDPKNVFAINNTYFFDPEDEKEVLSKYP
jgi:FAD/FMN-containing dehydrogenase